MQPGRAGLGRLSIVIANFNYAQFVGAAIESALAIRWPDVEVVVVDDGSTDGSRVVIEGYSSRVHSIFVANGGQRAAANHGFLATSGDVVVFLDSDDLLPPDLGSSINEMMRPGVSKIQFQMQRIDVDGNPQGEPFPPYQPVPTPAQVRRWMKATSAYPTPPGSANAYARWFLEKIFPVSAEVGEFVDSACLAAAPMLGEVVSCAGISIGYRQHGGNDSYLLGVDGRFSREVDRARRRWCYAHRVAGLPSTDLSALFRSRELLQLRVAALRMDREPFKLPGDGRGPMLRDTLLAPLRPGPEIMTRRLLVMFWCLATLVAPARVAHRLVVFRYGSRRIR